MSSYIRSFLEIGLGDVGLVGGTTPQASGTDGIRKIAPALDPVIAAWLSYCWQRMSLTAVFHSNSLLTPVVGLLLCTPTYVTGMQRIE